jgi:hypothetical protein
MLHGSLPISHVPLAALITRMTSLKRITPASLLTHVPAGPESRNLLELNQVNLWWTLGTVEMSEQWFYTVKGVQLGFTLVCA